MTKLIGFLAFLLTLLSVNGFLLGGGNSGCSSCCPQPIPCNCVPQQPAPCSSPCAAKAKGAKTINAQPLDELELRARVSGLHLDQQPTHDTQIVVPRQLELLERLGDESTQQRLGSRAAKTHFSSASVRFSPRQPKEAPQAFSVDEETSVQITSKTIDQSTTPETPLEVNEDQVNEEDQDIKCNSQVLKKLMIDNITENSAVSKRNINTKAEEMFGGNLDVICSRGHFSYIYSSSLYCEASKGPVTCIAFRQNK